MTLTSARPLTEHQLARLRDYAQLGTMAAVADFHGVSIKAVETSLLRIRHKLGVRTTAEALAALGRLDGAR